MTQSETADFAALLELIKTTRGFDFTGYKPSTLSRRIQKRMSDVGITTFAAYSDHLESEPAEFPQLFNTILINVTSFFRDEAAWQSLRKKAIEPMLERSGHLRVWCAGCATGEEAYSAVMMLVEVLGEERFKEQVKLYATDADEVALDRARLATYEPKQVADIPKETRDRFFVLSNNGYTFKNDLRRCVIFGRHDLISDAPISRLDLIICRNTLIYFNSEAQSRILARFNFGLKPEGVLFLGKSEMLLTHSRLFVPIDINARIFRKVPGPDLRDRLVLASSRRAFIPEAPQENGDMTERQLQMREVSFDAAPVSQIILDRHGVVILVNQQARRHLNVSDRDIGKPIQDLEVSYRPAEIRSLIDEVHATKEPRSLAGVEHKTALAASCYDIQIEPLLEDTDIIGISISFVDVTAAHQLKLEVERAQHDLETAYEEMQATNEELETTNEELQSSIEEMETTNEELQSTNEELETLNEELQSTNEELETMNDELRRRTSELNAANEFLDVVMSSMLAGVAVTDANLAVQHWNYRAEDLWGLRAFEVEGKPITRLDIGLDFKAIEKQLHDCLAGGKDFKHHVMDAVNRRGRPIRVRVSCSRLVSNNNQTRGLLILMEEWEDESTKPG